MSGWPKHLARIAQQHDAFKAKVEAKKMEADFIARQERDAQLEAESIQDYLNQEQRELDALVEQFKSFVLEKERVIMRSRIDVRYAAYVDTFLEEIDNDHDDWVNWFPDEADDFNHVRTLRKNQVEKACQAKIMHDTGLDKKYANITGHPQFHVAEKIVCEWNTRRKESRNGKA